MLDSVSSLVLYFVFLFFLFFIFFNKQKQRIYNNKLKEREEFPLVSIAFDGETNGIGLKIARLKKRIKKK